MRSRSKRLDAADSLAELVLRGLRLEVRLVRLLRLRDY